MRNSLSVDVTIALPRFTLRAAFRTEAPCAGIFGVSGAGKSTLLEALAGLRGAEGRIEHGGRTWLDTSRGVCLPPESRGVGYVPQEGLLFPHWSVERNVLSGAGRRSPARTPVRGGSTASETRDGSRRAGSLEGDPRRERTPAPGGFLSSAAQGSTSSIDPEEVVRVLDLAALMDRNVGGLSGGERQRVALARALCSEPSLLLLDEPLGSIDRSLRSRILPYLLAVKESFAIPTVFVSHDAAEVEILCDEVLVMHGGRIVATGRPHEILTGPEVSEALPGDAYENVLEGTVARRGPET
ncbi:MAG: ATP-binding cassette domain-containing protein, partial [Planctomycetes bacterium]|nr:ATP-binding cassette domain-containing protein [Planctomycetota bacterium]